MTTGSEVRIAGIDVEKQTVCLLFDVALSALDVETWLERAPDFKAERFCSWGDVQPEEVIELLRLGCDSSDVDEEIDAFHDEVGDRTIRWSVFVEG